VNAKPIKFDWNPGVSIYAAEAFLRQVGDEYGWLGGFDDNQRLRCVLPYTIVKKAIFRLVRFRVDTIVLDDNLSAEEEKAFLNSVISHFRSIGVDVIVPGAANALFRVFPDGALTAPYGNFVVDLAHSEEQLWQNLHGKHRNVIRTATKKGVEIRSGAEELEKVHALIASTLGRSKLDFMSFEKFGQFISALGMNVKILVAYHEGHLQGAAVFPFSNHSAYYLYGGSVAQPVTGAMNLLHWEAIRYFRNLGVKRYDFVGARVAPEKGSKQEGIKMFKERFGGEFLTGYTWKFSFKPIKYWLYSLAAQWRQGGDVVDQERRVAKLNVNDVPVT
jgi:hypothetical protein